MVLQKIQAWILERPNLSVDQTSLPSETASRSGSRSSHTKSRSGCESCKQKRIKCDEAKPECAQCAHRRITCSYPDLVPTESEQLPLPQLYAQFSLSREDARTEILRFMQENAPPCDRRAHPKYLRVDALELVDHWYSTKHAWMGTTIQQRILQKFGVGLALRAPYMLHAVLAFAASHLSYLYPTEPKWRIASNLHYVQGHSAYSRQLTENVGEENADCMFGCCYLLSFMAFWNLSRPSSNPTAGVDLIEDFSWIKSQQGIFVLQTSLNLAPYLSSSIWYSVFQEAARFDEDRAEVIEMSDSGQTESWVSSSIKTLEYLCNLEDGPSEAENLYRLPLKNLRRLMSVKPSCDNIGSFMKWLEKLPHGYIQLLESKDRRALLILSYWSALFVQVDQWWIEPTARAQCFRICEHLQTTLDSTILKLLEFPKNICSIDMKGPDDK